MRDTIGELWFQHVSQPLFDTTIVRTYTRNSIITGCIWMLHISNDFSTIGCTFIFCVQGECEIRLASYGSKRSSQFLTVKPFVRSYTHNFKTIQVICGRSAYGMTVLLPETFTVWFRVAREIRLESYGSRHASAVL